jgi:bisphosphoglycerate-dependent phosphoglycerate mutase
MEEEFVIITVPVTFTVSFEVQVTVEKDGRLADEVYSDIQCLVDDLTLMEMGDGNYQFDCYEYEWEPTGASDAELDEEVTYENIAKHFSVEDEDDSEDEDED